MSDQQILIVDAAHIDPARAQFPGLLVLANKAEGDDFTDLDLAKMAGRDVILWCHYAALLSEAIAPKAARLRIINGDKTPMSFASRPREAAMYARTNLQAYTPAAELPISHPMALPSAEPVAVPAKPSASVTPITEARVKQQAKAQDEPVEYAEYSPKMRLPTAFSERQPGTALCVAAWGQWLQWNGTYWENDTVGRVDHLARAICRTQAEASRRRALPAIRTVKSIVHSHTISVRRETGAVRPGACALVRTVGRRSVGAEHPWRHCRPARRHDPSRPSRGSCHAHYTRGTADRQADAWYEFLAAATNGDAQT